MSNAKKRTTTKPSRAPTPDSAAGRAPGSLKAEGPGADRISLILAIMGVLLSLYLLKSLLGIDLIPGAHLSDALK